MTETISPRGPFKVFVMREGDIRVGDSAYAVIYTRCALEPYAQAELIRLMEESEALKLEPDKPVLGIYHIDQNFPPDDFIKAYHGKKRTRHKQLLWELRERGFNYIQIHGEGTHLGPEMELSDQLIKLRDLPRD